MDQNEDGHIASVTFELSDLSAPVGDRRRASVTADGNHVRCADGAPIDSPTLATTLDALEPGDRIEFGWDTENVDDSDPPGVTSSAVTVDCG